MPNTNESVTYFDRFSLHKLGIFMWNMLHCTTLENLEILKSTTRRLKRVAKLSRRVLHSIEEGTKVVSGKASMSLTQLIV